MKTRLFALLSILFVACGDEGSKEKPPPIDNPTTTNDAPAIINATVVATYKHDTSAYTQGLEFYKGKLYEGTGDYETSSLRITDYKTGKVEKKKLMGSDKIFGEGITIFNDKIYQLTWQSKVVYQYNVNDITKPIKTFNWPYEGWGITHDATKFYVSDGTSNIYAVNPDNFSVISTIGVTDGGQPLMYLNELEMIDGFIFANVYTTDYIVKIDPATGKVVGKINMGGLKDTYFKNEYVEDRTDVLNGIAYDSASKKILITGKRWPKSFEIKIQ